MYICMGVIFGTPSGYQRFVDNKYLFYIITVIIASQFSVERKASQNTLNYPNHPELP